MKIGIIGAGNMGGAIARGLALCKKVDVNNLIVTSPNNNQELDKLKAKYPSINVSTDNAMAVKNTHIIILAVKPWVIDEVMEQLKNQIDFERQILISVAAGVPLIHLTEYADGKKCTVFQLMPNTAIAVRQSMTFIAHLGASASQIETICDIFNQLGSTMVVDENTIPACTSLASCGIAYVMRYIRAAVEGGVELGIKPVLGQEIMMQTMLGAVELLKASGNNPEAEIDKVTTPGGHTIKGLNAMEAHGFTTAVIEGLKASTPQ